MNDYFLKKTQRAEILIALIFLAGVCLRLAFSLTYLPPLVSETNHLPLAKHISFSFNNFYLPLESGITNHLIFTDLIVKLGMALFGEGIFGIRLLFVLLGSFTLVIVYKIALNYSKDAGIYALLLGAFNQYSIAQSGIADNPVIIVFFSALSIFVFWKGINARRELLWFLAPIWIIAYLTQEQVVIFVPVFYLFILLSSQFRLFSRSREIICSYFIFFSFVAVHLLFIKTHGTCLEYFSVPGYIKFSHIPTLTGVNFFLIKPVCSALNIDYLMTVNWEIPLMSALSGVVLFLGIIYALKNLKNEFIKLLALLAVSQILIFSFIKSDTFIWGEPNWAKLSFIPALCLAAAMLSELKQKFKYFKYPVYLLFIYMFFQAFSFSFQPKNTYPPHRLATFVDYDTQFIELYIENEFPDKPPKAILAKSGIETDYGKAVDECIKALSICPNEVRIHNYLAVSLYKLGFKAMAEKQWMRSIELEPFYTRTFESILLTCNEKNSSFYKDIGCLKKGLEYLKEKKPEHAENEFEKSGFRNSRPWLLDYYLGVCNLYRANPLAAGYKFREAIDLKPGFLRAQADLSKTLIIEGKVREAEPMLLKIIQGNPDYFLAYEYLGDLFLREANKQLAKLYFIQAKNIIHVSLIGDYNISKLFQKEAVGGN